MRTIRKYPLEITAVQSVAMPSDSIILCLQVQHGQPTLWCNVDNESPPALRKFRIIQTEENIDEEDDKALEYVGTVQTDGCVWHIHEDYS